MSKALLLEDPHPVADPPFAQNDIEVVRIKGALGEDELIEALKGVQILGIRSKTNVTARVLQASPELECIGAYCIGTNQIDLKQATRQGVAVFNAPYSNTRSVVELAICEIIALTRRIAVRNRDLQAGKWQKSASGSHEVRGKTLGIIGYGSIGTQLSVLAEALGMRVVFYDVAQKLALGNAQRLPSMNDVFREADVVSIHIDGNPANADVVGAEQFALMKPGALFINLSRGHVVDVQALRQALESGQLGGAAVDVFPEEPAANGDSFDSELIGLENTILTPHIGGSTLEAQEDIGAFVSDKIVNYMRRGRTEMSVNLPNLRLASTPSTRYRVTFVHRNTPGVLATVNQTFAEHGANIEGQILGTAGEIGYVITDIASELPREAVEAVRSLEPTIRLRVLKAPDRL